MPVDKSQNVGFKAFQRIRKRRFERHAGHNA